MRESTIRSACVAALVVCVLGVAGTAAWGVFLTPPATAPADTGFVVGEMMPAGLGLADDERPTLFVFLRRDCPASQSVAAWVGELVEQLAVERSVRTVAVFPAEGGPAELVFGESAGISAAAMEAVAFSSLPLSAVPAFVLADRDGKVRLQRAGAVPETERRAFYQGLSLDSD